MNARTGHGPIAPFERIVAEHGPTVLRVCRAVLGPTDAEDAWAETFMAALRAYPRLHPDSNIKAWLVTIAHRKAIDVRRAQARSPIPVDRLPEPTAVGSPAGWHGGLWSALERLPRMQRQAVAYHYVAGLRYKEVAAVTGSNTAAVRRAAADGIASLRRSYWGTLRKGENR